MMDQVAELWAPLIGRLAWNVRRGHGSFLTIEFGSPHLLVREPIASRSNSDKVRRLLQRRAVYVEGDWHFSILYGDWKLSTAGGTLDSDKDRGSPLDECLDDLEGQKLLSVETSGVGHSCVWKFDLGGVLEIWPSAEIPDDAWTLHPWNGDIIAYQPDGTLSVAEGERHEETSI